MQKFPTSTSSQLDWKSTTGRSLTKEAIDVTHSVLTNLFPVQGSQLVGNTPSPPLTPSPTASTKVIKESRYCAICISLGKDWSGKLALSSEWDEEDDNTKKKDQEQPEASPDLLIMPNQTLQPPKPYITKYFDNMSSDPPIRLTPKDIQRCDNMVVKQDLNATVFENLEEESLEDID